MTAGKIALQRYEAFPTYRRNHQFGAAEGTSFVVVTEPNVYRSDDGLQWQLVFPPVIEANAKGQVSTVQGRLLITSPCAMDTPWWVDWFDDLHLPLKSFLSNDGATWKTLPAVPGSCCCLTASPEYVIAVGPSGSIYRARMNENLK